MNRARLVNIQLLLCLCLVLSVAAQQSSSPGIPGPKKIETVKELDAFLNGKYVPPNLSECQTYALQWQEWYRNNTTIQDQLETNYRRVLEQNQRLMIEVSPKRELRMQIFIAFVAVGIGLFVAFAVVRWFRRVWPVSTAGKQAIALLLGATWISIAALICAIDGHLSSHPVDLSLTVGVFSTPAILFSGIAVWWFAKQRLPQDPRAFKEHERS